MRVLVLGGTGSIGTPLVRELVQHGPEVLALARSEASEARLLGLGEEPRHLDPEREISELRSS